MWATRNCAVRLALIVDKPEVGTWRKLGELNHKREVTSPVSARFAFSFPSWCYVDRRQQLIELHRVEWSSAV